MKHCLIVRRNVVVVVGVLEEDVVGAVCERCRFLCQKVDQVVILHHHTLGVPCNWKGGQVGAHVVIQARVWSGGAGGLRGRILYVMRTSDFG
jgi:hypothetical protein